MARHSISNNVHMKVKHYKNQWKKGTNLDNPVDQLCIRLQHITNQEITQVGMSMYSVEETEAVKRYFAAFPALNNVEPVRYSFQTPSWCHKSEPDKQKMESERQLLKENMSRNKKMSSVKERWKCCHTKNKNRKRCTSKESNEEMPEWMIHEGVWDMESHNPVNEFIKAMAVDEGYGTCENAATDKVKLEAKVKIWPNHDFTVPDLDYGVEPKCVHKYNSAQAKSSVDEELEKFRAKFNWKIEALWSNDENTPDDEYQDLPIDFHNLLASPSDHMFGDPKIEDRGYYMKNNIWSTSENNPMPMQFERRSLQHVARKNYDNFESHQSLMSAFNHPLPARFNNEIKPEFQPISSTYNNRINSAFNHQITSSNITQTNYIKYELPINSKFNKFSNLNNPVSFLQRPISPLIVNQPVASVFNQPVPSFSSQPESSSSLFRQPVSSSLFSQPASSSLFSQPASSSLFNQPVSSSLFSQPASSSLFNQPVSSSLFSQPASSSLFSQPASSSTLFNQPVSSSLFSQPASSSLINQPVSSSLFSQPVQSIYNQSKLYHPFNFPSNQSKASKNNQTVFDLHDRLKPLNLTDGAFKLFQGEEISEALTPVERHISSLTAINHSDNSLFMEIPPRRGVKVQSSSTEFFDSICEPLHCSTPKSPNPEDLLTSSATHFRPINSVTDINTEIHRYSDGLYFDISGKLDEVEFLRSSSGGMYLMETGERYLQYLSANKHVVPNVCKTTLTLRFPINQNDVAVQTESPDQTNVERFPINQNDVAVQTESPDQTNVECNYVVQKKKIRVSDQHNMKSGRIAETNNNSPCDAFWGHMDAYITDLNSPISRCKPTDVKKTLVRSERKRRHSAALRGIEGDGCTSTCSHPHMRFLHCCVALSVDRPLTR